MGKRHEAQVVPPRHERPSNSFGQFGLPYITGTEEVMRRLDVSTVQTLATLKDFGPGSKPIWSRQLEGRV